MLADDDIKKIVELMPVRRHADGLFELAVKILVPCCTAGIIVTVGLIYNLNVGFAVIKEQMVSYNQTLNKVDVFMSEPRFTMESFNSSIAPIVLTINRHDKQIDAIEMSLKDASKERQDIQSRVRTLESRGR